MLCAGYDDSGAARVYDSASDGECKANCVDYAIKHEYTEPFCCMSKNSADKVLHLRMATSRNRRKTWVTWIFHPQP